MSEKVSAAEFERRYAEESGATVEQMRALMKSRGRELLPCDCGWERCQGWAWDYPDDEENAG